MSVETREKILEDGRVLKQRIYTFKNGTEVWCPEKACIFCKHCTDIYYDSRGPYGFACELDPKLENGLTDKGIIGVCELFEEMCGEVEAE